MDELQQVDGVHAGVIYEERDDQPTHRRPEVLRFGRTVLQLWKQRTILPMRYGTLVHTDDELRELIGERQDEWERRLSAVAHHVEMLVHWERNPVPPLPADASGRDYLLARARAAQDDREQVDRLFGAVGHLVDDSRLLTSGDNPRLACLVAEDAVADFEVMLQAHALATGEQVWCSGPWPPFSFGGDPE
jgi:hypothetical protein